ncbi:TIGR03084 family metal-binding protein [Streptomyces clavuligerus]|uniref:TIGR03084 family metal-binding protein n=5 Tax=Streptomyces clavuligerus TaxID=1901 RepID=UPI0001851BA5|nr:TIGR03084 family metal-binding protein [Streptomyces clavuligerus]AXU13407.1 TIGR03084 family protein [Streptomyces clavuligerus]MBY6303366.1 TIGR03084 family protein [Streptomyces clavuligerus]QCS06190.1 TIGR03084 family protein [Streptomyces clavuligerus]QPJ94451.1 TIGR03084 family protein [Streptomyces clavuligerus]QPL63472.1 TIGR03084 family protein [Streptomyces clavuligerus]
MSQVVAAVLRDLRDEYEELDRLLADATDETWARGTSAPRWSVAHQVAHLAWTDRAALLAVTDPDTFATEAAKALATPETFVDEAATEWARMPPATLLAYWREGRELLLTALESAPVDSRFPWYGPPMGIASMASARLMETWAHGQDVADALGSARVPTARLRHIAHIGVRTRDHAHRLRGLTPPAAPFRIELTAPDGTLWCHGPEDAAQRVTGPALDFCLLVTRRARAADLAVTAEGPDAAHWLTIAQAFAGAPGPEPVPRPPHERTAAGKG